MIDWAAARLTRTRFDDDWIQMDHGLWLGRQTEFHDDWISSRKEDSADSNPNSTTTVTFQVFRWMIDWAAHSNPNSTTTGFRWITDSPVGRRTELEFDVDWILIEDRLDCRLGPEFDDYCFPTRMGRQFGPEFR